MAWTAFVQPHLPECRAERSIMTTINATNNQLELGFNGIPIRPGGARREGKIARAKWWFAKMRATVESAIDWQAADAPRPEQIWMPGAHREVKV